MMAKVLPGLDNLLIDELPDNMSTVTKDMQRKHKWWYRWFKTGKHKCMKRAFNKVNFCSTENVLKKEPVPGENELFGICLEITFDIECPKFKQGDKVWSAD